MGLLIMRNKGYFMMTRTSRLWLLNNIMQEKAAAESIGHARQQAFFFRFCFTYTYLLRTPTNDYTVIHTIEWETDRRCIHPLAHECLKGQARLAMVHVQ